MKVEKRSMKELEIIPTGWRNKPKNLARDGQEQNMRWF